VVTAGDLESKSGTPVKTGDLMFEIAPLDCCGLRFRAEDQISDVSRRRKCELATKDHPELKSLIRSRAGESDG